MRTTHLLYCTGLLLLTACQSSSPTEETVNDERLPNIVYILADDLGYGDLSCYGQQHFQTPNIDRLATQGMLFTQHYAGTTVCAPSRSALMSGQHTGHTFIRGNKRVEPEGQYPIPDSLYTLAEMLQNQGYTTGAFGKWGLGPVGSTGDPNRQGFNTFYGYNSQTLAHNYYPYFLWDNATKVMLEKNAGEQTGAYAPELIQRAALDFIDNNKDHPFFLYVPTVIPHAELVAPEVYMEAFRGKYAPETPYEGVDEGERFRKGPYGSQAEPHAAFAAMIKILDDQVGEIHRKIEELGLADNTLIIFTSDNGPHVEGGADPDFFDSNGPLKGYKRDLYEGGIRVPMIASWPGKITVGSRTDHISAFWDVWPTLAELTGAEQPKNLDGISFLPTLLGKDGQQLHDYLYWEFHEKNGRQAVRKGNWKAVRYNVFSEPDATPELYNLQEDIGEEQNVAAEHPDIIAEISKLMETSRVPSEAFPFGQQ
ncbi:MAG: arylsulfatase [Saprospiraceae bacterium]|nr:arylsulfatase [Lewinella sp.]